MPGKNYIGVGCWAIVTRKESVLLLKPKAKDEWQRPGGKIEYGESIKDAIIREIKEETGVDITVKGVLDVDEILEENNHWLAFGYHAEYLSGETKNAEPEKHTDVQWFPLDELPDNISALTKKYLIALLQRSR